jgi:hypothetical protein
VPSVVQLEPVASSVSPSTVTESAPRSISFEPHVFVSISLNPAGVQLTCIWFAGSMVTASSPPLTASTPSPSHFAARVGPVTPFAAAFGSIQSCRRPSSETGSATVW